MSKEIWTLIELANQYEIEKEKSEWVNVDVYVEFKWNYNNNWLVRYDETDRWEWDNLYWDAAVAYLISKSFGMIWWLVENEKIDYWKILNLTKNDNKLSIVVDLDEGYFSWEESLLMLLSIQDEPIEFLTSILK